MGSAITPQRQGRLESVLLQPQSFDLNRVVTGLCPMLTRLLGKEVKLCVELSPAGAPVHADWRQLEQVLVNLAVHARNAMPRGGTLRIQTGSVEWSQTELRAHPGAHTACNAVLSVSHTGTGMDNDLRRLTFDPRFTAQETGLGRSTVPGVVAQSGGHVEVDRIVGGGITVCVYLPKVCGREPDVLPWHAAEIQGKETVLVVEDQTSVRKYTAAALKACGYRVLEAGCGCDAMRLCEQLQGDVHLVLTDIATPPAVGGSLPDALQKRWPGIKILFMTAFSGEAIARNGILMEGSHCIQKPCSPEQLSARIRDVLRPPDSR
jgi:two-component system, cell cycle sensor histidine kinase and response regulator CckA